MRGGQWTSLCSYFLCVFVVLGCSVHAQSSWSSWTGTDCYLQPGNNIPKACIARQRRYCECDPNNLNCDCLTKVSKRYVWPPESYQYCTSDCQTVGSWCSWSQWYQSDHSTCHVTVVERTRKCCDRNTVLVDLQRCQKLGLKNAIEQRSRYVYNCRTSPMGRLAGVFGTVFVIVCVLSVIVFLRLRARRRHLRIMAQRSRSAEVNDANADRPFIIGRPTDDPYANVRAPVLPPSYDEVQPLPPPPPYQPNAPSNEWPSIARAPNYPKPEA